MYKAIKDRIIIKLDESEQGTLILPETTDYPNRGVVVNVGNEVSSVSPGDHIIFHVFDEINLPADNLAVVREKSVLAKFE